MKVLLGIICFHFLVMISAKQTTGKRIPHVTITVLTVLMAAYVVALMYFMEPPE